MLSFLKKNTPDPAAAMEASTPASSWAERLKQSLTRTRSQFSSQIAALFNGGNIDEAIYEELETILLTSDVGMAATQTLLEDIRGRVKRQNLNDTTQLREALKQALIELLAPLQKPLDTSTGQPFVIMLAGVNGAGKTTTIGKLANLFQAQGKTVLIAAGDTFRAAAREQLQVWGERNQVQVIAQDGGDPAAVIFDAVNSARARGIDIVLADTAGRLPTQLNLMEEIRKVQRVIAKALPGAPHEVLLVMDATTGQNGLAQAREFTATAGVTGIVLTKLDGTAKGGIVVAITRELGLPVRYVGTGESVEDLVPFDAQTFVSSLFD